MYGRYLQSRILEWPLIWWWNLSFNSTPPFSVEFIVGSIVADFKFQKSISETSNDNDQIFLKSKLLQKSSEIQCDLEIIIPMGDLLQKFYPMVRNHYTTSGEIQCVVLLLSPTCGLNQRRSPGFPTLMQRVPEALRAASWGYPRPMDGEVFNSQTVGHQKFMVQRDELEKMVAWLLVFQENLGQAPFLMLQWMGRTIEPKFMAKRY